MRTLYATQFRVEPPVGLAPAAMADLVRKEFTDWIASKYRDTSATSLAADFDHLDLALQPGHDLRLRRQRFDDAELATAELSHPDRDDPTIRWSAAMTLARVDDVLEVGMLLRIVGTSFAIKPLDLPIGRPRVVSNLIQKYRCTIGGTPLTGQPFDLSTFEVEDFVETGLLDPERRLPVVMISLDPRSEQPLVDPAALADKLACSAWVAVLRDKWTAFRLTRLVGKKLSCFDGAVRVYFPGFERGCDWRTHRLLLPHHIERFRRDRGVDDHLFKVLSGMAAYRYVESDTERVLTARIKSRRDAEIQGLRDRVHQADSSSDLEELFDELADENERLRAENEKLRAHNDNLEANHRVFFADSAEAPETLAEEESFIEEISYRIETIVEEFEARKGNASGFRRHRDAARRKALFRDEEILQRLPAGTNPGEARQYPLGELFALRLQPQRDVLLAIIGEVLVRLYVSPRVPSTARAEVERLAGLVRRLREQSIDGEGATLDLVRRRTANGFAFAVDPEVSVPPDPDFTSPGRLEVTTDILDSLEAAHGLIFSVLPTTLLSPVQLESFHRMRVVDESGEVLWESS